MGEKTQGKPSQLFCDPNGQHRSLWEVSAASASSIGPFEPILRFRNEEAKLPVKTWRFLGWVLPGFSKASEDFPRFAFWWDGFCMVLPCFTCCTGFFQGFARVFWGFLQAEAAKLAKGSILILSSLLNKEALKNERSSKPQNSARPTRDDSKGRLQNSPTDSLSRLVIVPPRSHSDLRPSLAEAKSCGKATAEVWICHVSSLHPFESIVFLTNGLSLKIHWKYSLVFVWMISLISCT